MNEASGGWQAGRLRQEEAARLLGVCERTFRRYKVAKENPTPFGKAMARLGIEMIPA